MDKLLSVKQVKDDLAEHGRVVSRQRVYQLIDEGRLEIERFGPTKRTIRVRKSSYDRYKAEIEIPESLPEMATSEVLA